MLFSSPSRRSKSRHSDSPVTGTTPTYSFNAQLPSVPANQVGISTPGQQATFALKLQSLMTEKLFLAFLHLFYKSKSKNLFGWGSNVFACFPMTVEGPRGNPIGILLTLYFAHLSTSTPKHGERLKRQKPWGILKATQLLLPLIEGWLSEAVNHYFISCFKNTFSQKLGNRWEQTVLEREISCK